MSSKERDEAEDSLPPILSPVMTMFANLNAAINAGRVDIPSARINGQEVVFAKFNANEGEFDLGILLDRASVALYEGNPVVIEIPAITALFVGNILHKNKGVYDPTSLWERILKTAMPNEILKRYSLITTASFESVPETYKSIPLWGYKATFKPLSSQ